MSLTTHHEQRVLPYTQDQMFNLVLDVENYPRFLPWCLGVRIRHHMVHMFEADVVIGFKFVREKFSTLVKYHEKERIETFYTQGPFQHLHNIWTFTALADQQCQIDFFIEFSLQSKLLQGLLGSVFHDVSRRMVSAFETRAHALYGKAISKSEG